MGTPSFRSLYRGRVGYHKCNPGRHYSAVPCFSTPTVANNWKLQLRIVIRNLTKADGIAAFGANDEFISPSKTPFAEKSNSLINNPSLKNGTLFAANSPNQVAHEVSLSKKRNLPSEHFASNATI